MPENGKYKCLNFLNYDATLSNISHMKYASFTWRIVNYCSNFFHPLWLLICLQKHTGHIEEFRLVSVSYTDILISINTGSMFLYGE